MHRKEKRFLKILCRGYIEDLLDNVGWDDIEKQIVNHIYIKRNLQTKVCMELNITQPTLTRLHKNLLEKLKTYLTRDKTNPILLFYK